MWLIGSIRKRSIRRSLEMEEDYEHEKANGSSQFPYSIKFVLRIVRYF